MDYIQLHQEDLAEFQQLSNNLLSKFQQSENQSETLPEDLEKLYDQLESLNQKGEILLQSSASQPTDENPNQVERLMETINRSYDRLMLKSKVDRESSTSVPSRSIDEIVRKFDVENNFFKYFSF